MNKQQNVASTASQITNKLTGQNKSLRKEKASIGDTMLEDTSADYLSVNMYQSPGTDGRVGADG